MAPGQQLERVGSGQRILPMAPVQQLEKSGQQTLPMAPGPQLESVGSGQRALPANGPRPAEMSVLKSGLEGIGLWGS